MQEYRDGSFGDMKTLDQIKEILEDQQEMEKTSALHFGTVKELEEKKDVAELVRYYGSTFQDINLKLDMIIKHFKIVPIIGDGKGG